MAADENFSPIILISFCSHRFPFSLVIASLGGVSVIDCRLKINKLINTYIYETKTENGYRDYRTQHVNRKGI